MANRHWVGGTGTWDATPGLKWATTNGGQGGESVPTSADDVFFGSSSTGIVTIAAGAICADLSFTGATSSLTIAFGTNSIEVAGTGTTIFSGNPNINVTGTPLVKLTNSGSTTRTVSANAVTEAKSISFEITAGTGTVNFSGSVKNITFSGTFTGDFTDSSLVIFGNLTLKTDMTIQSAGGFTPSFSGTLGTQVITTAGVPLRGRITFNGTGIYQLASNTTFGASPTNTDLILTSGTLDLNNFTLSHFGDFISNGTGTRAINGGTTGVIDLTATSTRTVWDMSTLTGFTRTGNPTVRLSGNNSSTQTILHGTTTGGTEARAMSFNFTAATGTFVFANTNWILDFNKSGSSTISGLPASYDIYGSYIASTNDLGPLTFRSTSATARVLPVTSGHPITINGVGGSFQFQGNNTTVDDFTITNGSFSTNGYISRARNFLFNNSNTKSITINATMSFGDIGGSTTQLVGSMVNTTLNASGQIYVNPYGVHTHNVDGGTFGNVYVETLDDFEEYDGVVIGGAASNQTITNVTFVNSTTSVYNSFPVKIFSGSTLNVTNFSSLGNEFGYIDLMSTAAGIKGVVSKSSGVVNTSYTRIKDSSATGGATWYSLLQAPYYNVDNGGTAGWIFVLSNNPNFLIVFLK
jgi:hypothetical protein